MRRAVDLTEIEKADAAGDDAFAGRGRAARRALDGGRILREPQEARVLVAALGVEEEAADLVVAERDVAHRRVRGPRTPRVPRHGSRP